MGTVLQAVMARAEAEPSAPCFQLWSARAPKLSQSYGELIERAARAAGFLQGAGVRRGDAVALMGTHHVDLPACWLGAMWLGAIPTILAEPSVRVDPQVYWDRLEALLQRVGAAALLTDPKVETSRARATYAEAVAWHGSKPAAVVTDDRELALLQHSSGTTGLQKGVMLSHGAVMRHAAAYASVARLTPQARIASWLPLYHDMGLIACFATPLITGAQFCWLSPFEWVAQPSLLLDAIAEQRSTHVWLPNFAFSFLAQRVRGGGRDLSSLQAVVNCSEPVSAEAVDAFATRFEPEGLRRDAIQACYAMAENVFAVTTSHAGAPQRRRVVSARAWREHRASPALAEEAAVTHLSNGPVIDGCEVKICEVDGPASLPAETAGRVLIRSPFLFDGYYRRDDLNHALFDVDGFFDTGDLGYLDVDGHLYVTGRAKDLVIIGGRNVYPHDVEAVISEVEGVYPGRVVVFGVNHKGLGTEALLALAESELPVAAWKELERSIRQAVPRKLDLDLLDARVVARGELRKSTSGKLARSGNREWYLTGRFGPLHPAVSPEDP